MTEQVQEPQQQTQDEQYLEQAQDFFARSMGRIKGQMQSDGAQLQGFAQQLPPDAQAQLQEMTDSYSQFEGTIDRAAQDAGVADALEETSAQSRQNADRASGQDPTDVAAGQAQEMAGDVGDQAQDAIGDLADSLPEGYEALG
jgi:methyl-accepting chemotaxis protein